MNKSVTTISIIISGIIIFFLIFSILGILYFYWGDQKVVHDSLSIIGSIFSPIATLGTAVVAAYLFNDWKASANYQQKKEIIDEFWNTYIDVKIKLVSLKDRAILANAQSPIVRAELFDSVSTSITKLYYLQQKVELYFETKEEDPFWTCFEKILQEYTKLLEISNQINITWINKEAKLMADLNNLHSKLYEYLRNLNPIKD